MNGLVIITDDITKIIGKEKHKIEILDVKKITKRGASYQAGIPGEMAEYLGINEEKEKVLFIKDSEKPNIFYMVNTKVCIDNKLISLEEKMR